MVLTAQQINSHTGRIPTTLIGLQKRFFLLRPIHKKSDYQNALTVATELSSRTDLTSEQDDYLEILTKIIADYEEKHFEMSKHSPQEILKFLVLECIRNIPKQMSMVLRSSIGLRWVKY